MALLGKIKASTLMETMVATVLIVIIFMVSSLILNNIFLVSAKGKTQALKNRIRMVEYQVLNEQRKLPYIEEFKHWEIDVIKKFRGKDSILTTSVRDTNTDKTYIIERILE